MDYSNISGLKELRLARQQLSEALKAKEQEIVSDYGNLKRFLNPALRIRSMLQRLYASRHLFSFVHRAYEGIRDFFGRRKPSASEPETSASSNTVADPVPVSDPESVSDSTPQTPQPIRPTQPTGSEGE